MEILRSRKAWLLLAVVAVWWGALWLSLHDSILVRVPILDEAFYLREGAAIADGRLLPGHPFIMSPLYAYLVAATGSGRQFDAGNVRLGAAPVGIWILQAAMWCGIVLMLYRSGRRILPRWAAPLPPLMFALYRPAAIFSTTILLEIPLTFLVTATLTLATAASDAPDRKAARSDLARAAWLGLVIGLAALLRAHAVVLLVPAALALGGRPQRMQRWAVLVATAGIVTVPAVIHNSVTGGRLAGISCNGGLNLYIGNGPRADGFYVSFAGFDFEADPAGVTFLSARLGRSVSGVAEADRIWAEAAWQRMRDDPWRTARLWLKKVWLHGVDWEISQVTPLQAWSRDGPLLRLLLLPFGVLASAGLVGLTLSGWWRDRRLRSWAIACLLLVGVQSVFFVVSRYRLALAPVLCLLGAAGVATLVRLRGWRLVGGCALVICAVLVTRPWGLAAVRDHWHALSLCNEAVRWEWLGDDESRQQAERLYRDALVGDPSQMVAYRNLARVLMGQGRSPEAEQVLAQGILRASETRFIQKDLVSLLLEQSRIEEALPRMAAYLRDDPDDPDMLHNYSIGLARTGRLAAATEAARRLMTEAPDDPRGFLDLGVLLARSGRPAEAEAVFREGLERHPGHADLRHNLQAVTEPSGGPDSPADGPAP